MKSPTPIKSLESYLDDVLKDILKSRTLDDAIKHLERYQNIINRTQFSDKIKKISKSFSILLFNYSLLLQKEGLTKDLKYSFKVRIDELKEDIREAA